MKPEVLLTMPIFEPTVAALEREYTVLKLWQAADEQKYLTDACDNVKAVVTVGARGLKPGFIESLPSLEHVACFGTPHGGIDHAAAARCGVTVSYTPDRIQPIVAELAAGMAVALMRRIVAGDRYVREGRWPGNAPQPGNTLIDKRCGIVGLGRIGRETARRLEAFGMGISYQGPRRKADVSYRYYEEIEALARDSDCLVVTCPLAPETRGIVNARVLEALGTDGFLVNVARGPIIDEAALIDALTEKRIAGAALDVFWNEPHVPEALMKLDSVVLLPHVGSTTMEIREERGRKLMTNLRAHFAGQPIPHPCTT